MQVGNAGLRDVAQVSAGSVEEGRCDGMTSVEGGKSAGMVGAEEGRSAGAGRMLMDVMDVMCAVMVVWLVCG